MSDYPHPRGKIVHVADLGRIGARLGDPGGQGEVLELVDYPTYVLKRYHSGQAPSLDTITKLTSLFEGLGPADQAYLDSSSAWPFNPVVDEKDARVLTGIVIPRIPGCFYESSPKGRVDLCLEQLLCEDTRMLKIPVSPPSAAQRLQIAICYAKYAAFLHQHHVIIGDINFRNWYWSAPPGGTPKIFAIDVDSYRLVGAPSSASGLSSPGWEDPLSPKTSCIDSDNYKLGLAVVRMLSRSPWAMPADKALLRVRSDGGPELGSLAAELASAQRGLRPIATRWQSSLETAHAAMVNRDRTNATKVAHRPPAIRAPRAPSKRPSLTLAPSRSSGTVLAPALKGHASRPTIVVSPSVASRSAKIAPSPSQKRSVRMAHSTLRLWRQAVARGRKVSRRTRIYVGAAVLVLWVICAIVIH